jgi:high-affinity K+ transport system ATPase subunit B
MRRGMQWRVSVTILLITAWLVFILIYAFFWSGDFDLFQNVVMFIASLIALLGGIGAVWASWGMRFAGMSSEHWR